LRLFKHCRSVFQNLWGRHPFRVLNVVLKLLIQIGADGRSLAAFEGYGRFRIDGEDLRIGLFRIAPGFGFFRLSSASNRVSEGLPPLAGLEPRNRVRNLRRFGPERARAVQGRSGRLPVSELEGLQAFGHGCGKFALVG
jgi:hypothetical protein